MWRSCEEGGGEISRRNRLGLVMSRGIVWGKDVIGNSWWEEAKCAGDRLHGYQNTSKDKLPDEFQAYFVREAGAGAEYVP